MNTVLMRLAVLLFAISGIPFANAVPVNWTIPATTLSGTGNSISGTFTYDRDTGQTSNINITITRNSVTETATIAALTDATYARFTSANSANANAAYVTISALTNAGGTVAGVNLGVGPCGTCLTSSIGVDGSANVTLTGTTVSGVPTLSGWALMVFAMLMGGAMLWFQRPAASRKF